MMFPDAWHWHVAPVIDTLIAWLLAAYGTFFDRLSQGLLRLLLQVEGLLRLIPWWLAVLMVAVIAWYLTGRWLTAVFLAALLVMIGVFGMWPLAVESLAIVLTSVVLALAVGLPLGVLMAESDRAQGLMIPVLDAMQTMPSFVYLIPAMMFFGLGKVPAILATLIYSAPPVIRLTNLGIRQVSAGVQEAARAYGANRWQLLWEVRLPLAVPSILAGVNQTTMMALAMVVIASMIGARGLGQEVLLAINRIEVGRGFEAGLSVVALAIVIDRLTQGFARRWKPPG